MDAKVTVHTRKTHTLTLTGEELLAALRKGLEVNLPVDAKARVEVPYGADWSGMLLDVGVDAPLTITWTTEETR